MTHAGTALVDDELVTAGGRVLNVTALGDGPDAAREAAYAAARMISFDGMQMRGDIAAAVASSPACGTSTSGCGRGTRTRTRCPPNEGLGAEVEHG